jgi:hypothetical protein
MLIKMSEPARDGALDAVQRLIATGDAINTGMHTILSEAEAALQAPLSEDDKAAQSLRDFADSIQRLVENATSDPDADKNSDISLSVSVSDGAALAVLFHRIADRLPAAAVPEISIMLDGNIIHSVKRLNDAPFKIHIHDHDVEGADEWSGIIMPDGFEEDASVSTYDVSNATLEPEGPHWASLRNPVAKTIQINDEA